MIPRVLPVFKYEAAYWSFESAELTLHYYKTAIKIYDNFVVKIAIVINKIFILQAEKIDYKGKF